jgi:hypothetical protein
MQSFTPAFATQSMFSPKTAAPGVPPFSFPGKAALQPVQCDISAKSMRDLQLC